MDSLLTEFQQIQHSGKIDIAKAIDLGGRLKAAGYHKESDACFTASVDILRAVIAQGHVEQALAIEGALYAPFIKSTETEEHYYKCFSLWSGQLQELGRKHQKPFTDTGEPNRLCFVLQTGVVLGHTEVMFRVVDSWRDQGIRPELYVAVLGGSNPDFKSELDKRGIRMLQATTKAYGAALAQVRDLMAAEKVRTAIWLGPPTLLSFALAMRLAPRQVLWSVKLHPIWVPEVDVHICGGHELEATRNYNGHAWTVAQYPLTLDERKNNPSDLERIRKAFPEGSVLLGVLAREEKLNSQEYLDAVCKILAHNPRARFLWTGRTQPEIIKSTFAKAGVSDRCHFIGWVDTNLFAEALDIFLETFPFGCGITGYQAMNHGTAFLSKVDDDTLYGSQLHGGVVQQFKGKTLTAADYEGLEILTAIDSAHYVALAQRLIDDVAYRREIGAREKAFFQAQKDALPRYALRLWKNMSDSDS